MNGTTTDTTTLAMKYIGTRVTLTAEDEAELGVPTHGTVCPQCFLERSITGECAQCDE